MSICVAMLNAAAFLPVSSLTPIAADLPGTQGTAGQAISAFVFFALAAMAID
jgi:predicted MFS family arabinose efflux permease